MKDKIEELKKNLKAVFLGVELWDNGLFGERKEGYYPAEEAIDEEFNEIFPSQSHLTNPVLRKDDAVSRIDGDKPQREDERANPYASKPMSNKRGGSSPEEEKKKK